MEWFGALAVSRKVANFSRNNQVFDKFKQRARDFRRGAELAKLGDYELIWEIAGCINGDVRGIMEQPLHSWMSENEYQEFERIRVGRLITYANQIESALNNAMIGMESFTDSDSEEDSDDNGFPGDEIVEWYKDYTDLYGNQLFLKLPDLLPEYVVNTAITCRTGEEVPWTGVWYPSTGLEHHSLTFAIKGLKMQPAYRVKRTAKELEAEGDSYATPATVAIATSWHPVTASGRHIATNRELWAKAGEPCPKAGIWQSMDAGAVRQRTYEVGESMGNLSSAYGITVWQWLGDQ